MTEQARKGGSAAEAYEELKRSHLNTAQQCAEDGLNFIPMVIEAHSGAWGECALKCLKEMAKRGSSLCGDDVNAVLERSLQQMSITIHKENARAVLRRAPALGLADSAVAAARLLVEASGGA